MFVTRQFCILSVIFPWLNNRYSIRLQFIFADKTDFSIIYEIVQCYNLKGKSLISCLYGGRYEKCYLKDNRNLIRRKRGYKQAGMKTYNLLSRINLNPNGVLSFFANKDKHVIQSSPQIKGETDLRIIHTLSVSLFKWHSRSSKRCSSRNQKRARFAKSVHDPRRNQANSFLKNLTYIIESISFIFHRDVFPNSQLFHQESISRIRKI